MTSRRSMLLAGGLAAILLVALALWALGDLQEQPAAQSDELSLQESVEAGVTPGASSPPGGSDSASITDSLEFTIRDASGRVKESSTAGGQ